MQRRLDTPLEGPWYFSPPKSTYLYDGSEGKVEPVKYYAHHQDVNHIVKELQDKTNESEIRMDALAEVRRDFEDKIRRFCT